MKNRIYSFFVLVSAITLFIACQEERENIQIPQKQASVILTPEEILSVVFEEAPELNNTELLNLLRDFQSNQLSNGTANTRSSEPTSVVVKRKYYLNQPDDSQPGISTRSAEAKTNIPIYELEFTSQGKKGLSVISGDRRAPHVLAYVEKFDEDEMPSQEGPNTLLQLAEMCIQYEVERYESVRDSIYAQALYKISTELDMDASEVTFDQIKDKIQMDGPNTRSTPINDIPGNIKVISGTYPLIPVTWSQTEPYNCKLPMGNCEVYFPGWVEYTNYPAGCSVVAIAHLASYIRPNMYSTATGSNALVNWSTLTAKPTITAPDYFNPGDPLVTRNMVGDVYKLIYNGVKSTAVLNAQKVVTGASTNTANVESYMKSIFNCGSKGSWKIATIKTSLENRNPVYVYGEADNRPGSGVYPFIIDGIMKCFGRIDNVPKDIDLTYLHANFGFGGGYQDGYYLMELDHSTAVFETSIPYIFKSKSLTMTPNIKKK